MLAYAQIHATLATIPAAAPKTSPEGANMNTVQARTARVAHMCSTCDWHTDPNGTPAIQPGHRYLIHVVFPGQDGHEEGTRPWRAKECIACACNREDTAGLLVAGSCATYCHGTTPCALPHRHDGDHSCRRCAEALADRQPTPTR